MDMRSGIAIQRRGDSSRVRNNNQSPKNAFRKMKEMPEYFPTPMVHEIVIDRAGTD
jgi:hypothetical protein